jgi:hypothetical protein
MSAPDKTDTHHKALTINLDTEIFGSFAEIGAGQEVARWFLRVGGASGTVAKTISAYDKEVSDDLYGSGTRYVSQPRLRAMLDNEWAQLTNQLHASRGATTRFFSFVNTISARNYSGTNECHGWVGLRFLLKPGGDPSDVILHINLGDSTNLAQQEAVGILGVNLIFAAYFHVASAEDFLANVFEDLSLERVEIDLVQLNGPAFESWDRRTLHASLVTGGYAEAVAFPAGDELMPPTELLYKKALVLAPGIFEVVEVFHGQLIGAALAGLPKDEVQQSKGALGLFCLSTTPFPAGGEPLSPEHIVRHVEELQRLGSGVMVFRAMELYTMSSYVSRYTKSQVHFAVGLSVLVWALQDRYKNLAGAVLEGVARLFTQNVRLCVFPMPATILQQRLNSIGATGWSYAEKNGMVFAEDLQPPEPLVHLYRYLLGNKYLLSLDPFHH